jgi:hypothetical protein
VAAAVYSYKTKHSTTDAIASAAVSDQRTISEILANEEIELGKDADLWITPEESGQQINVRTSDSEDLKISDVNVTTADPLAAEEELSSRQRHAAVSKVSPNVQAMHTRTSDGALIIETLDELNDADIDRLIESTGFAKVEVETLDETPRDSITIRGGAAMGSCTSGFAATYVGEIGFLSARHCSSPHSIFDSPSSTIGDFAPATKMSSTYKRDADISFFSVPSDVNSLSSTFYGSDGASTSLGQGPVEVGEGFTVCHRGRTTGWQCGETTSIVYQPTWEGACIDDICNSTFVRVDANQDQGDSGGPWVSGDSPAGIHKGGGSSWSVYSKLSYAVLESDDPKLYY